MRSSLPNKRRVCPPPKEKNNSSGHTTTPKSGTTPPTAGTPNSRQPLAVTYKKKTRNRDESNYMQRVVKRHKHNRFFPRPTNRDHTPNLPTKPQPPPPPPPTSPYLLCSIARCSTMWARYRNALPHSPHANRRRRSWTARLWVLSVHALEKVLEHVSHGKRTTRAAARRQRRRQQRRQRQRQSVWPAASPPPPPAVQQPRPPRRWRQRVAY